MKKTLQLLVLLFISLPFLQAQQPVRIASGVLIDTGIALHDRGEFKKAIEVYKKINRNDTNYIRSLYELGMSYAADSQFNEAVAVYQLGLYASDDREREPDFYNSYGSLLDNMELPERAIPVLDSGIAKYPAHSPLYLNKGITLLKINKLDEAEEVFKKVLLIDPYSYSSHYLLGQIALLKGKVVQAFLSSISYLMMNPSGRYYQKSISTLSQIASYKEDLRKIIDERKEPPTEAFQALEDLILSKIALDKNYKPLVKIDDPISRQIQVLFEKMEYVPEENDFWMQYYVPLFKAVFAKKQFEPFINHIFSAVEIEAIKDYNKKNKKENEAMISTVVGHLNDIRATRELNYLARSKPKIIYTIEEGKLTGKGPVSDDGKLAVGNWEYYYAYGNLKSKGTLNDKGEKTGLWTYYTFDQKISATETLVAGKVEGEVLYYFENGNLSSKSIYKNDELEGPRTTYYLPGSLRTTENYKNGKLEGQKRIYYATGGLHFLESYRSDTLHGPYESYYEDGQLEYKTEYTSGKLEGTIKGWHENGKLQFEGQYSNNELVGEWKRYHSNGQPKTIEHYLKGSLDGDYQEFHENGKPYYKAVYKKGKASGEILYTDDDGKLYSKFIFKNDLLTEGYYYDKTGKEISRSLAKNKSINLTSFGTDGIKLSDVSYDDKGLSQGKETKYYPSGKTKAINSYTDGLLNGLSTEYYPNGKKSLEINYVNKEKNDYLATYHQNGKLKSEGWYTADQAEGDWKFYNVFGSLTDETFYKEDDLHKFHVEYWPNGKKEAESENQYGWLKTHTQYDSSGNILSRIDLSKGSGPFYEKHFNGKNKAAGQYLNGKVHGVYTFYFFDGSVESIYYYKQGLMDSIYKNYYFGGTIYQEGKYKLNKKIGTWKTYYKSGKIYLQEEFKNGELDGKKTYYFENGKVETEVNYENGSRNGAKHQYNESGDLMYVFYYKDDVEIGVSYNDKTGKLQPMIPIVGGTGKFTTYYANGNPSASFEYSDGELNGKNLAYHPNGKLKYESVEDYGLTQGITREYAANGQLTETYTYVDNVLHGPFVLYNEKGQKKEEGSYYNDSLHGAVLYFDETTGKLKETRNYYFGTIISVKK